MNVCHVKELYHRLLLLNIPLLFGNKVLQEEYLRFLAVSAEIVPALGSIYIPQKLQAGWNIHFLQHHHNYYDVLDVLNLPDNQVKFLMNGEVSPDFLRLYSKSFGKSLLSNLYMPMHMFVLEKEIA